MSTILFHNTMKITDGHLDQFRAAVRRAVEFVEEHGPQLMVQVFVDEQTMEAHSFQLYRDSASVLAHWAMSDPYIQDVMAHCHIEFQCICDGLPASLDAALTIALYRIVQEPGFDDLTTVQIGAPLAW